jgi:large subunit ribosomal protein L25
MVELTVHVRKDIGKRANAALRREDQIPAILYGRGRDPLPVSVSHKDLVRVIREHRESGLVNLTIVDGGSSTQQQALYKEVSASTLARRIHHIDFQAIREGEKVHMKVAIVTKGVPVGVTVSGGVLVHTLDHVEIRVLPSQIPEQIEVEVGHLEIGDAVHLKDLKLEGFEVMHDLDAIVASVTHVREEKPAVVAPVEGAVEGAVPAPGAAPAAGAPGGAPAPGAPGQAAAAGKGAAAAAKGAAAAPAKGAAAAPAKGAPAPAGKKEGREKK